MLGLSGLLLPIRFLIPAFALAFILDLFLLFFMGAYVKKNYLLSAFPPDDSYKLTSRFDQLKAQYDLKKIQLLKPAEIDSACFYLSDLNGSLIVISENILESFSQEDMACFLSYAFQKIKSGDAGFLTVLSSFLFLWEKFFYGVSYPFMYFKQRKRKAWDKSLKLPDFKKDYARAENKDTKTSLAYLNKPDQQQTFSNQMGMGLAFGILSLMTRNLFYNNDRLLYQTSLSFPLLAKDSHRQGLDNNKENADHNNRGNTDNKENTNPNNKENADHNNRGNTGNRENTNPNNKENTNNKENADHNNRGNTDNKENTNPNNKENADHNNRENTDNRENTNPNNKENNDKNKNDDSWNKSHTGGVLWKNSNRANLKERVRKQALFLWKLDSFLALNPPQLPLFFAPLFLTNFLTNLSKKDYIPLQPSIKNRVKKLVGGYPP